jgi:type II secretory pathway predicted ATPase ExeA
MYLDLFKLRELPFRLSPDPEFLYLSKNHARAKAYMESTIWFTDGFVVITGEIGSGKTTLIETFLKELDQDVVIAQINQTQVSALEFLQTLLVQFGFQPFKMKKAEILATLNQFLIEQYASNRKVLVIVDEAQNLSPKVLEEVRMLSGVETTKDKVLRIILAGQPELNQKLDAPELVQLVQRVRLRFHLSALTREDMEGYIRHRLEVAGAEGREIFQPETFDRIYRYTGGTPRLINTLCDTAMMAAFSADRDIVTLEDVDAAIGELQWVEFSQRPTSAALLSREAEDADDESDGPRRVPAAPPPRKATPTVGRIVVSTDQGDVAEVPLKVGRMVIGRTADNDLQIDSRFVSRHHCQVVSTADLSVIEDLNSTNGIFLNQKKIRRHVLIDGDIIELGTHRLRYVEERTGGSGTGGVDTLPGAQETALLE